MRKMTPNVKDEHTGSFSCIKESHVKENGDKKWKTFVYGQMGMHFGCLLAPKVKNGFSPIMVFPPIQISLSILFPSPCNNYFNQFLEKLNDWVNETRNVVDSLMGSFIDIWIFPFGPKG